MNKFTRGALVAASALSLLGAVAVPANAAVIGSQSFGSGVGDWIAYDGNTGDPATATALVATETGTLRITSTGDWQGAMSRFGGVTAPGSAERTTVLGDGYIAALQVYLDPAAVSFGAGFDLSVATTTLPTGDPLRDFIFHVAKDTSTNAEALLVAGSNNSNGNVREDLETIPHATVTTAGWYTLQHSFYELATGALAVDLNLLNAATGEVLWTTTLSNPADLAVNVGGARYQWLTVVDGSFRFDNQSLERVTPVAPLTTKDQCSDDNWKTFNFKNQGQCVASLMANVNAGK